MKEIEREGVDVEKRSKGKSYRKSNKTMENKKRFLKNSRQQIPHALSLGIF